MEPSIDNDQIQKLLAPLRLANAKTAEQYPVETGKRQPVHTVYGGAHLFTADLAAKLGKVALANLERYGGGANAFFTAASIPCPSDLIDQVYASVKEKLVREPVEDFRIDFEDGYGNRSDSEEDGHAQSAALEVAKGMKQGSLPPFIGIRIKTMSDELCARSLRTMDIFISSLVQETGGKLPDNFVVTLPKILNTAQVTILVEAFIALEQKLSLPSGALKMEFMVETPQSILSPNGGCNLPILLEAAEGRCIGAHFGTYDYTALCNITADHQAMDNAVCDFAKHMMQVSLAPRGLMLSDGATNIMPVPKHRASGSETISPEQERANMESVTGAWRLHASHIRHSLVHGFYQGWDLHPAQLPTRYASVYAFFLEGFDSAAERLSNFVQKAAQATLVGDVFDDAATGQGLLNYFLRGINCGAFDEARVMKAVGLTQDEIRSRSFLTILANRKS